MKTGNIEKLISYYTEREKFSTEIKRAADEFFDVKNGVLIAVDEISGPYFNEWLVFDFRLSNGMSLLADYYDRNPQKRPLYEMQEYKDLQDNVSGLFEVEKVDKGKGLEILVLHTRKKYYVKEYSATFELEKRDLFFSRIGRIGDHWELVGAPPFVLGTTFDKNIKNSFFDPEKIYSPKDALEWKLSIINNVDKKEDNFIASMSLDVEQTIEKLDEQLLELGLIKMVNAKQIQVWIATLDFKRTHPTKVIIALILGLLNGKIEEEFFDMTATITELANNSPHFSLGGKTPQEKSQEISVDKRKIDSGITKIGDYKSWRLVSGASALMRDGKYYLALEKFEKAFGFMKKENTTLSEVYRVYTNLAIGHLTFGEIYLAKKCLEVALELNPNYDFGVLTKKRLETGFFDDQIVRTIRWAISRSRKKIDKELKSKITKLTDKELIDEYSKLRQEDFQDLWLSSPAREYYEYIKRFKINFKTDEMTTTPVVN